MEFLEPSEAKTAFTKLAYSKFKHLPLYLEWAPSDTFTMPPSKPNKVKRTVESSEGSGSTTSSSSSCCCCCSCYCCCCCCCSLKSLSVAISTIPYNKTFSCLSSLKHCSFMCNTLLLAVTLNPLALKDGFSQCTV